MYFLTTSSSVSFAPVSWVTLQSLTLVNTNDANETIPLTRNISAGYAQGTNVVDFTPNDDGTQWVAIAVFSIGGGLNVTRRSGIATLHFYELFKSAYFAFLILIYKCFISFLEIVNNISPYMLLIIQKCFIVL